ncbi:ABC transporter ATP-binding protein [Candidatus Chloroploca sp. M-50]|uniref:ABC transporter ATP-binding protein n=1 Tax=Candidatus Chloroploca mongolica TaxID=2528176 RepID=A0ABS4D486_9CHLR|nr:ABC transporter ATP-binding protein [Candidatus Chloroploca mongolica]MBP1464252.1 ABC transporter ATP-binding protein [Candidatus Chloroploca mongolica]
MSMHRHRGPPVQDQRLKRLLSVRSQLRQLRYVPQALRLVWQAARGWTLASTVLLVIQGVLPVVTVYLTRELVNGLVAVVERGGTSEAIQAVVPIFVLMGLVLVTGELLGSVQEYVRMLLAQRTRDYMNNLIHSKAITLDLHFYESPTYYDQLQRASVDAIDRPLALLENLNGLLQHTITLVAMGGVLFIFAWWMPLVLLAGTLPALWVALRSTWIFHRWRQKNTMHQRRLVYFQRVVTLVNAAMELRIFGLGDYFKQSYDQLSRQLHAERLGLARQQMLAQIGAALVGLVALAGGLGWMGLQTMRGRFNLGDLAMFWQAMNQGLRLMRSLLTGVGDIYRNLLFLEDLFTFLELEPQIVDPAVPTTLAPGLGEGIRMEEVTFRYEDSERNALEKFNLTIPAGQIVAIVGENGAGKSTLIKLLCRFYDPQEGRITWDGVNLRELAQDELRRRISVLFQQPFPYHDSAGDNIRFGDMGSEPTQAAIEAAAHAGGAAEIIDKLPEGYATILGRWFGYTELSIGEWQRLALARAFVRQADLVILDEPTSAMDSWAEHAWMTRFRDLIAGRTALIITHRFTTAMQADIIHVMVGGRVIESGTHSELVALGGHYASSWNMQMREVSAEGF